MTYASETGAENRLRVSGAGFWYVCHTNLVLDSSGTRFRRRLENCSISKPETGVHVTEIIIYDLFLFNLPLAIIASPEQAMGHS